jgi:hypothetical protein
MYLRHQKLLLPGVDNNALVATTLIEAIVVTADGDAEQKSPNNDHYQDGAKATTTAYIYLKFVRHGTYLV